MICAPIVVLCGARWRQQGDKAEAKSRLQLNIETSATTCVPKQFGEKLHLARTSESKDLRPLPEQTQNTLIGQHVQ